MENLLRGIRSDLDTVALELYAVDGVVHYGLRTFRADRVVGALRAHFPQARIDRWVQEDDPGNHQDWMWLDEDEYALVQPYG